MFKKNSLLFSLFALISCFSPALLGATYHWNGAGIEGGTGDADWFDPGNWLVDDLVPSSAPGVNDDVIVNFNEVYEDPEAGEGDTSFGIVINQAADVASITATNLDKATGAAILVTANSQFGRLDLNTAGPTSSRGSFHIDTGITVQLYPPAAPSTLIPGSLSSCTEGTSAKAFPLSG